MQLLASFVITAIIGLIVFEITIRFAIRFKIPHVVVTLFMLLCIGGITISADDWVGLVR